VETVAFIVFPLVLVAALAWAVTREDTRLRRRARRYRQLEFEGLDQLRRDDPYPEQAPVPGGYLREPDGRVTDAERVLHEELERIRDHTRRQTRRRSQRKTARRGRGAECLL
jgi:hypothetical protein